MLGQRRTYTPARQLSTLPMGVAGSGMSGSGDLRADEYVGKRSSTLRRDRARHLPYQDYDA